MIRILHIVSSVKRGSGVMNFIMNYYRNIDRKKIQFDFLYWLDYDRNDTYLDEINELGGIVYSISTPGLTKEFYKDIKFFFQTYSGNYKAIHLHEVYLNMLIAPIARKYGINHIIAHSHTTKYSDLKLNALRNRILCFPIKYNTDIYFACSKAAGEFLYGKKYVQDGKVKVINNAIDSKKFRYNKEMRRNKRKELGLEGLFVVGHIGRFNEQKNHEFLIDIFYEIHKRNKNSVLLLVGVGPLEDKIKKKIHNLMLSGCVFFLGERNDVENILQVMDAFVFPSIFEGLGITLIEAQSTGVCCFTSDVVPNEAKVTDNFNYLNLKFEANIWAETILRKCKNFKRQDYSETICDKGFNIEEQAKKLESIYLNLI